MATEPLGRQGNCWPSIAVGPAANRQGICLQSPKIWLQCPLELRVCCCCSSGYFVFVSTGSQLLPSLPLSIQASLPKPAESHLASPRCRRLPSSWAHPRTVTSLATVLKVLSSFWLKPASRKHQSIKCTVKEAL